MVGGEQVRNKELRHRHSQRKKVADQRKEHLIRALTGDGEESENVLLDVYNSIQEEVYAKSQMLLKVQGKVGSHDDLTTAMFLFHLYQVHKGTPFFQLSKVLCKETMSLVCRSAPRK